MGHDSCFSSFFFNSNINKVSGLIFVFQEATFGNMRKIGMIQKPVFYVESETHFEI